MLDDRADTGLSAVEEGTCGQPETPATPGGRVWAVAYTHPQAERWAARNLAAAGYPVYLPLVTVQRRDRATRTLRHQVQVPLFPRYLFVADGPWSPIRYTPGVHSLVMADGKPGIVVEAVILALQAGEAARGMLPPARPQMAPGTACSLRTGPFRDQPAVVVAVSGKTARVGIMVMGAIRDVLVPVAHLIPRD